MPYISGEYRDDFDFCAEQIAERAETSGELNYAITKICDKFVMRNGENYENYNRVLGVLEAVKMELYRRKVVPYEDKKMRENGDVYSFESKEDKE